MAPITYNEFKARVTQGVERYLQSLAGLIQQGQLRAAPGYVFLFPSTLIFTETKTHYVFELLGSRREHGSLLIRENSRITSFNRLVGGFEADPSTIYLFGTGTSEQTYCHITYSHMTLTSASDMERLEQRFPGFASLSPKSQLRTLLPTAAFMPIDAQSIRTLALSRCYLTSHVGEIIRPRYVNFLFGESIESDVSEFVTDVGRHMNIPSDELMGVAIVPDGREESLLLAAEFSSLYLQDVEETTLTQFLRKHEETVKRAFGADHVFFEESLPWIDGDHDEDEVNIRPDLIARRGESNWLIVDFKLPLLNKEKITTGKRARRKFIYTVNDGISQLFRYAEYFRSPANKRAAAQMLGGEASDPQLLLVVGSSENVNMAEIDQAKRSYKEIDIVDYDTLIRMSVGSQEGHEA